MLHDVRRASIACLTNSHESTLTSLSVAYVSGILRSGSILLQYFRTDKLYLVSSSNDSSHISSVVVLNDLRLAVFSTSQMTRRWLDRNALIYPNYIYYLYSAVSDRVCHHMHLSVQTDTYIASYMIISTNPRTFFRAVKLEVGAETSSLRQLPWTVIAVTS